MNVRTLVLVWIEVDKRHFRVSLHSCAFNLVPSLSLSLCLSHSLYSPISFLFYSKVKEGPLLPLVKAEPEPIPMICDRMRGNLLGHGADTVLKVTS